MQFIVIGRDGADEGALERRMKARQAHLNFSDKAIERGEQITGGAILNEQGEMCGSVMIVDFPTRADVDERLKVEPYVTGDVWREVEVFTYKLGPSFL